MRQVVAQYAAGAWTFGLEHGSWLLSSSSFFNFVIFFNNKRKKCIRNILICIIPEPVYGADWTLNMNERRYERRRRKTFTTMKLEQMKISRVNIVYFFFFVSFSSFLFSHAFHCSNINKLCTHCTRWIFFILLFFFFEFNFHVIVFSFSWKCNMWSVLFFSIYFHLFNNNNLPLSTTRFSS